MILKNKRSTEVMSSWPFWILFVVVIGSISVIIVKIGNVSVAEASAIPEGLEDEIILASRFFNSENCFTYQDELGRIYPGVFDTEKVTQENMDKCFPPAIDSKTKVEYAFSLILTVPRPREADPGPPIVKGPVKTFNFEDRLSEKEITEDVFVMLAGKRYDGILRIKIQDV